MKTFVRPLFLGWLLLPALVALAQDNPKPDTDSPPPPTPPAAVTDAPVVAPAETPPADAPPPAVVAPAAEPDKSGLRHLDTDPAPTEAPPKKKPQPPMTKSFKRHHGGDDRVSVFNSTHVEAGENVSGDAVAVLGDLLVDGEVQGDAVCVLGDNTINGTVHGEVIAVLGDVTLGPKAHVDGKIVCVGGDIHRAPGAYVAGKIVKEGAGKNLHMPSPLQSWWTHGLRLGRPLAFGAGLAWLWVVTAVTLAFYALLALLFPGALRTTGDMLVQRPVAVVLSALFTIIALPVLFLLLLVTIVGIPVALIVLPVGVTLCVLFGKAAIYGLVGRRVSGDTLAPAVAVLAGGMIFVLLYLVPIAGLALTSLLSALGFGCSLTALFASRKKNAPPAPPVSPLPPSPGFHSGVAGFTAPAPAPLPAFTPSAPMTAEAPLASFSPTMGPAAVLPPVLPATPNAALPRAGFWIRTAALVIDLVLIVMIFGPMGAESLVFVALAGYGACMWKLKGTTIGGIVCGLRVVRLDDREIDWPTAVVRALASFLSFIVAGLGFVWVVFDEERQSWHDKIAGTVVVHAPKGTSLV